MFILTKPSSLVTSPPINTEAITITASLPEITPFIALQLRVARLEAGDQINREYTCAAWPRSLSRIMNQKRGFENSEDGGGPSPKDRKLQTRLQDHKKKHDSDDVEDDVDNDRTLQPGSNQALTSMDGQITDTRDAGADSSMQDEGNGSDMEGHLTTLTFQGVDNYVTKRKKKICKADLDGSAFNLVQAVHKNNVFLQYQWYECIKLLTNKADLYNPEGHQILRNVYEPLPLGGPPGQVTIQPQFFFNKDLDYLLTVIANMTSSAVYGHQSLVVRKKGILHQTTYEPYDCEASQIRICDISRSVISGRCLTATGLKGYLKDGDGDGNSQHLRYQVNNRMLRHDLHWFEVVSEQDELPSSVGLESFELDSKTAVGM
ncbi:hypothetical protein Tco_0794472 [Tanacetum coccineum]